MTRRLRSVALTLAVAGLGAHTAVAQTLTGEIEVMTGHARIRSAFPAGMEELTGWGIGTSGLINAGRLGLRVSYFQVGLAGKGTLLERSTTQGDLTAGVRINPWLWLGIGPSVLEHRTIVGDQRWVGWGATVAGSVPVYPDRIILTAQLAVAPFGGVRNDGARSVSSDLRAGVQWMVPRTPMRVTLGYRFQHLTAAAVDRAETMDRLVLSVGYLLH